jgi:phosphoglycolate phosphatase-like HAD superfamily hydrolase
METIAWDVDDVLNDLMRVWYEQAWLPSHPKCALRYETLAENPPHRLLGVSVDDYLASLDEFRLSDAGRRLAPVPEVLEWFRRHGHKFRHVALTATPLKAAPDSAAWVLRHYGNWIRSFHFVPSPRKELDAVAYDGSKADFMWWWGKADILIDDSPLDVEAAKRIGLRGLLMPRPWNESRISVLDFLDSLIISQA